jgi:hypothetical protein
MMTFLYDTPAWWTGKTDYCDWLQGSKTKGWFLVRQEFSLMTSRPDQLWEPFSPFSSESFNLPFFIATEVGLGPLYCGHFLSIVPAPDDRWGWLWSNWWNEDWQRKPKYSEETCPSATLSTINPTWPDPGSKPGRRDGKPATNRLSYGAALWIET